MHRIFQEHPELFSRVSEVLSVAFAPPVSVTVLPTDLTETRPLERRVDTLLRFDTEEDGPFLLAVEAQGKKDPAKPASWAYYLAYLYTKYQLPPVLLVVCQDRLTAEWAARPVRIGPAPWASLTLRPLVAGPHNMPVITSIAEARKDLALATLAAITHADNQDVGAILKSVSGALREVSEELAYTLAEFIAQGLGKRPAAELWRQLMAVDLSFFTSPISEEIRDEGRMEGRVEGVAESILLLLAQRDVHVPDEARQRITGCADLGTLHRWLLRAPSAASTEELFEGDEGE
ncbi:hypothetical protein ACIRD2_26010 [Streptomyces sp. NPDC093595]|uniref:hypothetical protein n=1 Tax=Streptomyces sp. NPDC093595 TaxID=3366045 RepID=UPI003828C990